MSVLGTTDYDPCNYLSPDGATISNVRFVQEATVSFHCRDWDESDRIVIFLTDTARTMNWEDNGHKDRSGKPKRLDGLRTSLEKLELKPRLVPARIPEGRTEDEIWEIFQIILDHIEDGDEVVFDVTHGFRSIPMLAFASLNYAKALKNVTLKGIFYGAFDARQGFAPKPKDAYGPPTDVPIFDLTKYDNLLDWGQAVDRFLRAGDASEVGRLAKEGINPLLRESRGRHKAAAQIDKLAKALERFTRDIAACRGPNLSNNAQQVKKMLSVTEGQALLKPLTPLMRKVEENIEVFDGDMVRDGLRAARWCLDHNLIQQGYTILQEFIVTYVCLKLDCDYLNRKAREKAAKLLHKTARSKGAREASKLNAAASEEEGPCDDRASMETARKLIGLPDGLVAVFSKLSERRNDLNHAGFRERGAESKKTGGRTAESLAKKLGELLKDVESLLEPDETLDNASRTRRTAKGPGLMRCAPSRRLFPHINVARPRLRLPFC
jgi:CRISPR-associated Csx2 family protein